MGTLRAFRTNETLGPLGANLTLRALYALGTLRALETLYTLRALRTSGALWAGRSLDLAYIVPVAAVPDVAVAVVLGDIHIPHFAGIAGGQFTHTGHRTDHLYTGSRRTLWTFRPLWSLLTLRALDALGTRRPLRTDLTGAIGGIKGVGYRE
jgi:hypothetical protein